MKHDKLIAVMLVSLMTVSVFGVIASSTPVAAQLTASKITGWTSSNDSPQLGQNFWLWGYLTDINNLPIVNRNVEIWYRFPSETSGHLLATVKTAAMDGYFEKQTAGLNQPTYYRALFRGDGIYATSKSPLLLINANTQRTHLFINGPPSPQTAGTIFMLNGWLGDSNWNDMQGKPIEIWQRTSGDLNSGTKLTTTETDQWGDYSVFTWLSPCWGGWGCSAGAPGARTTWYRAVYMGEVGYRADKAPEVGGGWPDWNALEVSG